MSRGLGDVYKRQNYDKIITEMSALLDDAMYYEEMTKAVNPYGDGLACGRIVRRLVRN